MLQMTVIEHTRQLEPLTADPFLAGLDPDAGMRADLREARPAAAGAPVDPAPARPPDQRYAT
jgi:hypothetical protein